MGATHTIVFSGRSLKIHEPIARRFQTILHVLWLGIFSHNPCECVCVCTHSSLPKTLKRSSEKTQHTTHNSHNMH